MDLNQQEERRTFRLPVRYAQRVVNRKIAYLSFGNFVVVFCYNLTFLCFILDKVKFILTSINFVL